ncbi:MAG: hydroxyethylthiazole kinase [Armatimonadota bacterium]|nr:hydroxyethylthiazole kinase [Armatimonadota bacterium]
MLLAAQAGSLLTRIRETRPLVHHLTNFVAMNDVANVTLATGALPIMAHAPEEMEEVVSAASVLVLNLGTWTQERWDVMLLAARIANRRGIPVVLDPVGAGASRVRTESALKLLREKRVTVVRGNRGEIAYLTGALASVRGVESLGSDVPPQDLAQTLAREHGCIVAVTGPRDWISDGKRLLAVDNGHPLLQRITGSGCMATAAIGCFLAVPGDPLIGTAAALAYFGYAAELAARDSKGPGSFRVSLLDHLALLDAASLEAGARILEDFDPGGGPQGSG